MTTDDAITRILAEKPAVTRQEKISRAKGLVRTAGNDPLLSMIADLLDFAETGRPLKDWKAADKAVKAYKANF